MITMFSIRELRARLKNEKKKRSMIKSLLWRVLGVGVLAAVTYLFTGDWITTSIITFVHHFSFIWIYFLNERLWQKIGEQGRKRKILKTIFYEIILGHGILGLISLIFTGNWSTVTLITITYIENKLWMYYLYEYLWDRTKWATQKEKKK